MVINYRSVWKWSSSVERWRERRAARRQTAPRWGRHRHPKLWCWSWSWGALVRTPAPPGVSARARCRSRRSSRSGGFPSRWLEANLRGGKKKERRQRDQRRRWWDNNRVLRQRWNDWKKENKAKKKKKKILEAAWWESCRRHQNNPSIFISFFRADSRCGAEKMRCAPKKREKKKKKDLFGRTAERGGDNTAHGRSGALAPSSKWKGHMNVLVLVFREKPRLILEGKVLT